MPSDVEYERLEQRVGRIHLKQRLGIQSDRVSHVFGRGRTFFHVENLYSVHGLIRNVLRCLGLHRRGQRNAVRIAIRHNEVDLERLPAAFNGYTILQVSDPHLGLDAERYRVLGLHLRYETHKGPRYVHTLRLGGE